MANCPQIVVLSLWHPSHVDHLCVQTLDMTNCPKIVVLSLWHHSHVGHLFVQTLDIVTDAESCLEETSHFSMLSEVCSSL